MPDSEIKLDDLFTEVIDAGASLEINRSPIQRPGYDPIVHTVTLGGPDDPKDRSMYISIKMLTKMLDVARSTPMRRAQMARVGIRVDIYQKPNGHRYEVWSIIGVLRPEPTPTFLGGTGS